MKQKLVLKISGHKVYIRQVDYKTLKNRLEMSRIHVYDDGTKRGKTSGTIPHYYILISDLIKFIEVAQPSYIINII